MSRKSVVWGSLVAFVGLVFGVFVLATGCQKEKPAAQQKTQAAENVPMHQHASTDQAQVKVVAGEQTTCPVMGGPINKDIFVEYQGKKVYFCCNGCPDIFKADPAKYLAKLPQFAQ
jgi:YHS domain-containing protein